MCSERDLRDISRVPFPMVSKPKLAPEDDLEIKLIKGKKEVLKTYVCATNQQHESGQSCSHLIKSSERQNLDPGH